MGGKVFDFVAGAIASAIVLAIIAGLIMFIWNNFLISVFPLSRITFIQAIALKCLFLFLQKEVSFVTIEDDSNE